MNGPWFVYILRCADDTLYTGITTHVARRLTEHNAGAAPGARYTRSRIPVELLYVEEAESRSAAAKREWHIKCLDRLGKLALVKGALADSAPIAEDCSA